MAVSHCYTILYIYLLGKWSMPCKDLVAAPILYTISKHVYTYMHAIRRESRLSIARNRIRLVVNRNRIFAPFSVNPLFPTHLLFDAWFMLFRSIEFCSACEMYFNVIWLMKLEVLPLLLLLLMYLKLADTRSIGIVFTTLHNTVGRSTYSPILSCSTTLTYIAHKLMRIF